MLDSYICLMQGPCSNARCHSKKQCSNARFIYMFDYFITLFVCLEGNKVLCSK